MKAISLWQPWASFMQISVKQNETRGHLTHYRGDLVICSAQRKASPKDFDSLVASCIWQYRYELTAHTKEGWCGSVDVLNLLPLGCALCVVEVTDCFQVLGSLDERVFDLKMSERCLGNYKRGRWVWQTRNCRALKTPIPVKGKQGFFNLPPEVEAQVRGQL